MVPCSEEPSLPKKLGDSDRGHSIGDQFNRLFEIGGFQIGYCLAEITVNEKGMVDAVRVVRPENGDERVRSAIIKAIGSWKYKPAAACGRAAPSTTSVGLSHCPVRVDVSQKPGG